MITQVDAAWAAGFYEGEGTVYTGGRQFTVSVAQKHDWPLRRLISLFGGRMCQRKQAEMYVWYIAGEKARAFLEQIAPWLSPKRLEQLVPHLAKRQYRLDSVSNGASYECYLAR